MAPEQEIPEVKEDETVIPEEGAEVTPDSSQETTTEPEDGDAPEEGEEAAPEPAPAPVVNTPAPKVEIQPQIVDGIKRLPDESDREFALRLEVNRLRTKQSGDRNKELIDSSKPAAPVVLPKTESEILKKYKPGEIQALREVLPEIAKEMGYVSKNELAASNYETIANEQIQEFIAAHPEYSLEKDPEQVLWKQLRSEYQTFYKPPVDPKKYKQILEKVHKDIFKIEEKGPLPTVSAAQEKVKVASHASGKAPASPTRASAKASTGLRLDMLKGFSDDEKNSIESRAQE